MILTWETTLPTAEEPGTGTIGVGSLASLRTRTRLDEPHGPADILFRDGRAVAQLSIVPATHHPATDYRALADEIARVVPTAVFDPQVAGSSQLRAYLAELRRGADAATDDLEFLLAAGAAGRKYTKWAIPLPYPRRSPADVPLPGVASPFRVSHDPQTGVVTLRIDAFLDADAIDRALAQATSPEPPLLILDLRTCPGIDLASLRALAWLIDQPTDAGLYFGPARRERLTRDPPDPADLAGVPTLDVYPTTSLADIHAALRDAGAARLIVHPREGGYRGPIAVLTARRTTSSAEAMVAALADHPRVTTLGDVTGGRPFLAREEDIGQGWSIRVAAYDYLAPGPRRIGPSGLVPDARTADATAAAMKLVPARTP
jgi:hypothetical protein